MNSRGSVIPVIIAVNAPDKSKPPTNFFLEGRAFLYIAKAAPLRPNIMNGNLPAMKREVPFTTSAIVAASAPTKPDILESCAKYAVFAPLTNIVVPSARCTVPSTNPVYQNGV